MGTVPSNTALQAFFFTDFPNSYIPNILEEVYKQKIYQPLLQGKKDLVIVEIGANVGLVSYYFKDYAKTVYAIEPSQRHLECLNSMIKQNQIENIVVCPYAISNKNGKEKFYHSSNTTAYSLKSVVNDTRDFEEVETKTWDNFVTENNIGEIDLLKLDAEGAEDIIIAFEGFQRLSTKIKVICGEWHTWSGFSKELFTNTLSDLGFDVSWLRQTDASVFVAERR